MKRIAMIVGMLTVLTAPSGNADMLPPKPQGRVMQMRIVESQIAAGGVVLQIPADVLRLQAADIAPFPSPGGPNRWRDVVAGVLLSLGLILAGRRWFRRRGEGSKRGDKLLLAPAFLLLAGSAALLSPPQVDAEPGSNLALAHSHGDLSGTVTVQLRSDIKDVVLHLTPPRSPRRPRP